MTQTFRSVWSTLFGKRTIKQSAHPAALAMDGFMRDFSLDAVKGHKRWRMPQDATREMLARLEKAGFVVLAVPHD